MINDIIRSEINEYLKRYFLAPTGKGSLFNAKTAFKDGNIEGTNIPVRSLEELVDSVGETFCEMLFRKIKEKGLTDSEVYKKADMDRKLFSKIRSNPAYHPQKKTVIALALALELPINEFNDMLARAEYALSPGSKSDVIIRYFIERKVYDIIVINIALHDHGLPVLE